MVTSLLLYPSSVLQRCENASDAIPSLPDNQGCSVQLSLSRIWRFKPKEQIVAWLLILVIFTPLTAYARIFELTNASYCKTENNLLSINCSNDPSNTSPKKLFIKEVDGKWLGAEIESETIFEFNFIKEDENIILLNYPVNYSGLSTVAIFKKNNSFYITEIYYSDIFEKQGVAIDYGKYLLKK